MSSITRNTTNPRCPREESNLRTRFRKPLLYPLSYEGEGRSSMEPFLLSLESVATDEPRLVVISDLRSAA